MKKMRFLFALAVVVVMISTVAFAAELNFTIDPVEFNGEEITVNVRATETVETVTAFGGWIEYDPEIWEVTSISDNESYAYGDGAVEIFPEGISFTKDAVIFSFTARALNAEAAVGSTFALKDVTVYGSSFTDELFNMDGATVCTLTVEAAAPAATTPTYTGSAIPATYTVGEKTYTNVWTGAYTVVLNGNDITKVGLRFAGKSDEAFAVAKSADGEGSVSFKIAVVGAPTTEVATPIVFANEWIAAEAE